MAKEKQGERSVCVLWTKRGKWNSMGVMKLWVEEGKWISRSQNVSYIFLSTEFTNLLPNFNVNACLYLTHYYYYYTTDLILMQMAFTNFDQLCSTSSHLCSAVAFACVLKHYLSRNDTRCLPQSNGKWCEQNIIFSIGTNINNPRTFFDNSHFLLFIIAMNFKYFCSIYVYLYIYYLTTTNECEAL